ncbi:MAG: hypothetical protein J7623_23355 [Chitinophaga sp.]|uniref:hypothetical protein n=1 Tax=Chitinophaga sp. TaxID=1869181 RepID=UPI001B01EB09|nr:hypothetical protein [Chitinophaga sp.]MBO9731598.1 hypothetical protein [Chitinophaga sp.]
MGVDLRVITGHRLSAAAVLDMGDVINKDPILRELDFYTVSSFKVESWHNISNADEITACWEQACSNSNKGDRDERISDDWWWEAIPNFHTHAGRTNFHPEIVQTDGWGQKLWIISDEKERTRICAYYNRFAQLLQQRYVIFYGDSSVKSSLIDDEIYNKSMEQILEWLLQEFGFKHVSDMADQWFEDFGFYIHTVKY